MSWNSGFISGNGIRIHYYRTGGSKPPLILNHGAGDSGLCWTRIAEKLEQEYDVIMPDARGHGRSSSGKGDYTSLSRAADLKALIEALGLHSPIIGGHSMGADTSLTFAASSPDKLKALILEDPPILLPGEIFSEGEKPINAEDGGRMIAMFLLTFKLMPKSIARRMAEKNWPSYPESEIGPWLQSKKQVSYNFLRTLPKAGFEDSDPFGDIQKVQVPVKLFIGDRKKGSIVSPESAGELKRLNPAVEVSRLEDASHDIRRTRFEAYLSKLKSFLNNVSAF